jgi:2-isopropylmalate synthase
VIQKRTDMVGGEVSGSQLWQIFQDEYLPAGDSEGQWGRYSLGTVRTETDESGGMTLHATLGVDGTQVSRTGTGNGPIAALLDILGQDGVDVRVLDYSEHALSEGGSAMAAAYVECAVGERVLWGVGIDANTSMSSLKAVISAVNRAIRDARA